MIDDKYLTKEILNDDIPGTTDYPKTTEFPRTVEFLRTTDKSSDTTKTGEKYSNDTQEQSNKAVRFFKWLFVKNIDLKLLALGVAGVLWLIIAGIGG